MVRLNIEEILHRYKADGGRNFIDTYSVLKERLLKVEYTQTVAEFPGANSHGPDHITRVLKKLDEILGPNPLAYVNEFELWTTMMAVLYHDVGLLQARDHHAEIGAEIMLGERNSYIFDRLERELIQTAIFSHSSRADIRQKCKRYPPKHKIGDFPANAMLICALVRLADELDEDYRRGDEDLFQKREITTKHPNSVKYWRFNQRIRAIHLDPPSTTNRREVQFQVEFRPEDLTFHVEDDGATTPFTLFALKKLLKVNSERLTCNAFFPEGLRFSHMTLWLVPLEGSSWDPREIPLVDQDEAQDVLARFPDDLRQTASGVRGGQTPSPHPVTIDPENVAVFAPEPSSSPGPDPTDRGQPFPQVPSITPATSVPVATPLPPAVADRDKQEPLAAGGKKKSDESVALGAIAPLDEGASPSKSQSVSGLPAIVSRRELLVLPHHLAIRSDERELVRTALSTQRVTWLVTEWGLGRDGFLASCFTIPGVDDRSVKLVRIKMDALLQAFADFRDSDLLRMVREQIDPQGLAEPIILLDRIPQEVMPSPDARSPTVIECERVADALLRAMPTARIVLASRFVPGAGWRFPVVELAALGVVECKSYIMSHPGGNRVLVEPDLLDRLYSRSEGIPAYIDRMLEALHAASFEDVVSPSVQHDFSSDDEFEFFCTSIRHLLLQMDGSASPYMRRNVKMLKLLAMLTYGETFGTIQKFDLSSIRHFHQREPFYPDNVTQLQHLHLIQSASIVDIENSFREPSRDAAATSQKLLIVPKQIRDYVTRELFSEDERREIAHRAADLFLGPRWREGELSLEWIKVAEYNPSRKLKMGLKSPFPVLLWMLQDEIKRGEKIRLDRVLVAANVFLDAINDVGRYHDLYVMSDELVRVLDAAEYYKEASKSSYYLGCALRMIGRRNDAIDAHRRALEEAEGVSSARRAWTHIELALCYEELQNFEVASHHAERARELAEPESDIDFFARYIIILANATGSDADVKEKLHKLEAKARSKKRHIVADNIALTLAQKTTDPAIRIQIRNRVLANAAKDPGETSGHYNTSRAAVGNAADMVNVGRAREVSEFDRRRLGSAYSYLYEQRMRSLFDDCHEALWQVEKSRRSVPDLVKLVQFGSSFWSLQGNERREAKYINELEAIAPQESLGIKSVKTSFVAHFFGGVLRRVGLGQ